MSSGTTNAALASERLPVRVEVPAPEPLIEPLACAGAEPVQPAPGAASVPDPVAPAEPRMLLFGAHRRSGTTWLAALLNGHHQIHLRNEGWFFNDRGYSFESWLDPKTFGAWAKSREARGTWLRHIEPSEAMLIAQRAVLRALLKEATVREGWKKWDQLRWIGDKTTAFYFLQPDLIHALFPDAAFLNMIRDGRDVAVSDLFLLLREGDFGGFTAATREHLVRAAAYHGRGIGKPVPLFNDELMRFFANEWVRSIAGGGRMRELFGSPGSPGLFLEVRYEDLVADTVGVLRALYRSLGVEDDPRFADWIVDCCRFENFSEGRKRGEADPMAEWRKGVSGDWRNYFTQDDKQLFKQIAGTVLVELGYEPDLSW